MCYQSLTFKGWVCIKTIHLLHLLHVHIILVRMVKKLLSDNDKTFLLILSHFRAQKSLYIFFIQLVQLFSKALLFVIVTIDQHFPVV